MSKHNLAEYALAKESLKALPEIKKTLDETYKTLYKHTTYLCASYVLDAISESLHMIDRQYKAAKKIVELKGKE